MGTGGSTRLRRAATKRKKSKLLEANLTQKKIKSEVDPSTLPPPLPVPSKSEEFWTWIGEHSRLIPESTQSFLTEIIQRPTERELFEKPEKARFSKPRDSGVLSSKLNSIKIKEKTEYDPKMGQLVEERLAKAGLLLESETELADELEHCQAELREVTAKNRWHSIILQV